METIASIPVADQTIDEPPAGRDLKRLSVQGSAVSLAAQVFRWILNLAALAILARMLRPDDFGLVAMMYAVISFAEMFAEFGLTTATVQTPRLSLAQASALFWINLALSIAIGGIVACTAPAISLLYREPRLTSMTLILAVTFPISALGMQHRALLTRQMRFGALAGVELLAMTLGLLAAVVAAWWELSYWALLVRHYVFAVATCIGIWLASGWRPGWPWRAADIRHLVVFGAQLTAFDLIHCAARSMDKILLGWRSGTHTVGLYDKAYQLLMLPVYQISRPLSRVVISSLSRLQDDPPRFRTCFRTAVLLVASLGMPITVLAFVIADDAVLLCLGNQWIASVPVFRALAPAAFFGCFSVATDWTYAALGQGRRKLHWGIVTSAATVLALAIGVHWGAIGVAAAMSTVFCTLTIGPPGIIYCFRGTPLSSRDLIAALWRPVTASAAAGAVLFTVNGWLGAERTLMVRVLASIAIYGIIYVSLWWSLPRGHELVRKLLQLAGEICPVGSACAESASCK